MYAQVNLKTRDIEVVRGGNIKLRWDTKSLFIEGTVDGFVLDNYEIQKLENPKSIILKIPQILPRLVGSFKLIVGDSGKFELAAIDSTGISEMYYATIHDKNDAYLLLGTDFITIARNLKRLSYNRQELTFFIKHGYCRFGRTIFNEIRRIPPGHYLTIKNGTIKNINYLNYYQSYRGGHDYQDFKRIFESSLIWNYKKNPGTPFVLLSGGLIQQPLQVVYIRY